MNNHLNLSTCVYSPTRGDVVTYISGSGRRYPATVVEVNAPHGVHVQFRDETGRTLRKWACKVARENPQPVMGPLRSRMTSMAYSRRGAWAYVYPCDPGHELGWTMHGPETRRPTIAQVLEVVREHGRGGHDHTQWELRKAFGWSRRYVGHLLHRLCHANTHRGRKVPAYLVGPDLLSPHAPYILTFTGFAVLGIVRVR